MSSGLVIGSVPAMHYRPKVGRSPYKVDVETALLLHEAVQELLNTGQEVTSAYQVAFGQIGVVCRDIRFVFWSRKALQTVAESRRSQLQEVPFPPIFSFVEQGSMECIHPGSVFRNAVHFVSSGDRKIVEQVRWNDLPF